MNPFNPSFGKIPAIYLDRNHLLDSLSSELENPNSPYQTSLIYGMRGIGKTTFLTDLASLIDKKKDWMVVNLAINKSFFKTLLSSIYNVVDSKLKKAFSSVTGIKFSIPGFEVSLNTQLNKGNFQVVFENILEKLKEADKSLLITIDEIKVSQQLIDFTGIYQIMLREGYHVSLIMTGLPSTVANLQNVDGLTFLLRSGRIELDMLNLLDVKLKYQQIFNSAHKKINNSDLNKIAKLTQGYSYAFQLLGYLLWQKSDHHINSLTIDKVIPEYKIQLARNAYGKMFHELRPIQRKFLSIMAHTPVKEVKTKFIANKMKRPINYISVYRQQLLDSQLIRASKFGYVAFSLPFFKQFILDNEALFQMD